MCEVSNVVLENWEKQILISYLFYMQSFIMCVLSEFLSGLLFSLTNISIGPTLNYLTPAITRTNKKNIE